MLEKKPGLLFGLLELFQNSNPLVRPLRTRTVGGPSKHQASKRHSKTLGKKYIVKGRGHHKSALAQHERVVLGRAKNLGISVNAYEVLFPRGTAKTYYPKIKFEREVKV
jgi:hypothetical protein